MIDTIKFLVPLDDVLLLQKLKLKFKQIIKHDLQTKIVDFELYTLNLELGSHKKSVSIKISDTKPVGLFIEFSVPKYEKGNNVEMTTLSNLTKILETLYTEICSYIDYTLPHFSTWHIYRLDICYNWIFKNLEEAETTMSFLQRLDYSRKRKATYDNSVMFVGSAYTVKFYLKGAEFRKNDFKKITNVDTDRALELLSWADKIVRFEVTFRRDYLRKLFNEETREDVFIHQLNDVVIEKLLNRYLNDNVFRYVTLKNTTEVQIEEKLYSNFSKTKATRLYQFFRDFYLEGGAVKSRILAGGLNRVTIYRYKKDLKSSGVGFDIQNETGTSLLEQLVIPSENSKFDLISFADK